MELREHKTDFSQMLHPACGYEHPQQVLRDEDLTVNEKRTILAAWASDACAVEAEPALRAAPSGRPVLIDDVLDALRALDRETRPDGLASVQAYRRLARRRRMRGGAANRMIGARRAS